MQRGIMKLLNYSVLSFFLVFALCRSDWIQDKINKCKTNIQKEPVIWLIGTVIGGLAGFYGAKIFIRSCDKIAQYLHEHPEIGENRPGLFSRIRTITSNPYVHKIVPLKAAVKWALIGIIVAATYSPLIHQKLIALQTQYLGVPKQ